MSRTELLVAWVYLIDTFLVNKEISINWDDCDDWTIVDNLLLDILFVFCNTVIRNFEFLEIFCRFLTLFRSLGGWAISVVLFFNQTINLCIIKSSWYKPFLAIFINNFITCQGSLRRKNWMLGRTKFTPSIINDWNWSNSIWRWAITLRNNRSLTFFMFFSEIECFRNSSLFVTFITYI